MNFNNCRRFFVFLLIMAFCGCATTPASVQRLYKGDPLASESVITIIAKHKTNSGGIKREYSLLKVDGEAIDDQNDLVEILPGAHLIVVQLEKIISPKLNFTVTLDIFGNRTNIREPKNSIVITAKDIMIIDLDAGKKYRIAGEDNLEGEIYKEFGMELVRGSGHWKPKIEEAK